jgi:hypothetical protein
MYTCLYKKTYAFFASSWEKWGKDTPIKTEPIPEKEKSTGFLGEFWNEIRETFNEITDAPKSKYQAVRETYKILVATGAITDFSNILSLAKRWTEWSGRSGMRAVLKALKDAKNGTISIVTYANNQYDTHSLQNYEKIVRWNTSQLNVWIVKWLVHLSQINPSLSLSKETWQEIATYCANRWWNTKIIGNDTELATFMGRNYGEKKLKEETKSSEHYQQRTSNDRKKRSSPCRTPKSK